jgi:all-trans-8'-apo-beta-carotenal 15,15'-oxygenase
MNGGLLAFDETDPAYRLDPETLATIGPAVFGDGKGGFFLKAHAKYDPIARQWLMMGVTHGPSMTIHAIAHAADGALVSHQRVKAPRQVYLHDFFATEHYVLFLLHPLHFAPLNFLLGRKSVIESLEWRPEEGALLMVLPRAGGEPRFIEAPASFMWHSLNAYEKGTDIVADFVGYAAPDHFIGKDAQLRRIMEGMSGKAEAEGHLRRYIVTPSTGHLKEEILLPGRHEFPMHDPRAAMREHRIAYLASGGEGVLNSGTRRADLTTGRTADFDFGPTSAAGEPVFAPKPGGAPDEGWLLVQVLDGAAGQSFFAVFDAKAVDAGPIARLHLPFSLPISFHGTWVGA